MTSVATSITPVPQWNDVTCLAACVATILSLPADRVPEPVLAPVETWFARYNADLIATTGHALIPIPVQPAWPGYWIASLRLAEETSHAVVYKGDTLAFDPGTTDYFADHPRPDPYRGCLVMPWSGPAPRPA